MSEITCIYVTLDTVEADLIQAQLASENIPCYLRSDNAGGTLPYLTPVRGIGIMVNQEDQERAAALLQSRKR